MNLPRLHFAAALVACAAVSAARGGDAARLRAVGRIHELQSYRLGKNSFVESTDRRAGAWTGKGYRFTLLDVQGAGSLRHIWTTTRKDGPYVEWQFYVDGESEPSIRGRIDELVRAAENVAACPNPACSVPFSAANRDWNFFVPVPFEKSLRIDVVQETPRVGLLFAQLDYRTGDDSLRGVRLRSERSGAGLALRYSGWRQNPEPSWTAEFVAPAGRTAAPGERVLIGAVDGPAIIRRLRIDGPLDGAVQLQVRYDGAAGYAIDAPLRRLFGEFQGASFERTGPTRAASYLPMPFRSKCEIFVENRGREPAQVSAVLDVEKVPEFRPDWGYLHVLYQQAAPANGHQPPQILYVRGRGHWLGMSLFNTGHDHGGGDFAVVDGETDAPAMLHGVNGEDYFTFAWFGQGQHQPYAQAITNERGRYRHHFENPYPFSKSLLIQWGAFPGLRPESVAVWYQDSPEDTTVRAGAPELAESWDVFGPVPLAEGGSRIFGVLPSVGELDAGKRFLCRNTTESFESGWMREETIGTSLNLTYISRHGSQVESEKALGGNGHAFLARKRFISSQARTLAAVLTHDDPIEVELNGKVVYRAAEPFRGFQSRGFELPVREGLNEIVVRLSSYFNETFNWAGFNLRLTDAAGKAVRLTDLN